MMSPKASESFVVFFFGRVGGVVPVVDFFWVCGILVCVCVYFLFGFANYMFLFFWGGNSLATVDSSKILWCVKTIYPSTGSKQQ